MVEADVTQRMQNNRNFSESILSFYLKLNAMLQQISKKEKEHVKAKMAHNGLERFILLGN